MPYITTIFKRKVMQMTDNNLIISVLVITLLNLGLVTLVLVRVNGLRKDLRTPVVKKFNAEFKRKPVDIPRIPENFAKNQRDDKPQGRANNQQSMAQNRPKNNPQQNRPMQRRPAAKAPDVFSNELAPQAHSPVPPRPVAAETAAPASDGGRRPLPPRFNANAAAELAPPAPALALDNDGSEAAGMEFDRSKMAHGRRNVMAKPVIEDDNAEA